MSTVIKLKTSANDTQPIDGGGNSILATGELAYTYCAPTQSNAGGRLYIGTGTETNGVSANVEIIGGSYFTSMLDHVHGVLTASSGVIVDSNKKIDEWRVDNIQIGVVDGNTISIDQLSDANGDLKLIPGGTGDSIILTAGTIELNGAMDFTGDQTITGNLTITGPGAGNLEVDGEATLASAIVEDLSATRVVYVGTGGALVDDAGFTYTGTGAGGELDVAGTIDVGVQANLASAAVEDLTATRVTYAGTGGELVDDSGMTYTGTGAGGKLQLLGNIDVDVQGTFASANVQDLTDNRIVLAGANGELEDDANLTFDGTTLNVGQGNFTVARATGDTYIAGDLEVDGTSTLADVVVENLTNNRIVIVGATSNLEDDSNFTFDGTTFKVGTTTTDKFRVDVASGNVATTGTLDVDGAVNLNSTLDVDGQATIASLNVEDLTSGRVVFAGTNGELVDDSNFTFNSSTDKLDITGSLEVDNVVIDGNDISTTTGNLTITPNSNAITVFNTTSAIQIPVGNDSQKPPTGATGMIRYNTTTSQYEGYSSGAWQGLGGVIDQDLDTYIIAQVTPHLTDPGDVANTLYFVTGGTRMATLDTTNGLIIDNDDASASLRLNNSTLSTSAGDLYLDPGNTGAGSPTGNVVVYGNLQVHGTTTTVNSTTVTIDDPVFTLGGDTTPTSDDNLDRGIEFKYHNGTAAKLGFFGWDDSAERFKFIADATNTAEVFSGAAGDVEFGNILADSITWSAGNFTPTAVMGTDVNGDMIFIDEDVSNVYGVDGQVLQMDSSGVPFFGHIDCGTY